MLENRGSSEHHLLHNYITGWKDTCRTDIIKRNTEFIVACWTYPPCDEQSWGKPVCMNQTFHGYQLQLSSCLLFTEAYNSTLFPVFSISVEKPAQTVQPHPWSQNTMALHMNASQGTVRVHLSQPGHSTSMPLFYCKAAPSANAFLFFL